MSSSRVLNGSGGGACVFAGSVRYMSARGSLAAFMPSMIIAYLLSSVKICWRPGSFAIFSYVALISAASLSFSP
jgi:hypothetical protein